MQYANSMQQHGVQRDETMCVQHGSSQPVPMDTQQVGVDVQIGDASFDRSAVLGYAPTFQLHEGRLVSFCVHCGFHEAIT